MDHSWKCPPIPAKIMIVSNTVRNIQIFGICRGPNYLSALFHKETSETLINFIIQRRISQSLFLLNATNHQIQDIAQMCGIPDANYFTKLFKKNVSLTPYEYRRQMQRTETFPEDLVFDCSSGILQSTI